MNDYAPEAGPHGPAPRSLPRPPLGLVRPKEDAKVAGVCSAIARATNSDPLLWRVLFAVLILFAGAGLIVYALLWLFTPAEGDTAAPLEALFGRGRSSTPAPLTLALAVGVTVAAFVVFWDNFPIAVGLGVALILAVVYLVRTEPQRRMRTTYQQQGYIPPMAPPASEAPSSPHTPPAGYRAPFAPYGPYAAYTTQSTVHGAKTRPEQGSKPFLPPLSTPPRYGTPPPPPQRPVYGPPRQAPPPRPPKPRRPRSKLPLGVLSVMAIGLGIVGIIDLAGASVPFGWYLATALTICAGGLLVGTWIGRARSMIAVGIILSLILMVYTAVSWGVENFDSGPPKRWEPGTVAAIQTDYTYETVDGTLDLRNVDFAEADDVTIYITVERGSFRVILPSEVDVTATGSVDLGYLDLFGWESGGNDIDNTIEDLGADGPGGGHVTIDGNVDFGALEITR